MSLLVETSSKEVISTSSRGRLAISNTTMRTRTDTDYNIQTSTDVWTAKKDGSQSNVNYSEGGLTHSSRMDDVATSEFRKRQSLGLYTFNPMERTSSLVSETCSYNMDFSVQQYNTTSKTWQTKGGWSVAVGKPHRASSFLGDTTGVGELLHSQTTDSTTRNLFGYNDIPYLSKRTEVIDAMHARMSDSRFMGLVLAGELAETTRMLNKAATKVLNTSVALGSAPKKTLRELKKLSMDELKDLRNPVGAWNSVGRLANAWLEARYGWQSLYYDIRAIAGLGNSARKFRRSIVSDTTSYSNVVIQPDVWSNSGISGSPANNVTKVSRSYTRHSKHSAGALFRTNPIYESQDIAGERRIFSSAWELVPFSFVIDWFVNVGDKFAALDSSLLVDVVGSWYSCHSSLMLDEQYTKSIPNSNLGTNWRANGTYQVLAHRNQLVTHVTREANPVVSLIPAISTNWNKTRITDAAALLRVNSKKLLTLLD